MSEAEDSQIENNVSFKMDADNRKLFAVYNPNAQKIELTSTIFKEELAKSPFASLFLNEYLVVEFLHRYKNAEENECFECEIGERRDAHCDIAISEDKMKARFSLTPNFGGKEITLSDVKKVLAEKKIVWGVLPDEEIEAIIKKGRVADLTLALGLPAVPGIDAKFENLTPSAHERIPLVDENGDVDYRELGDIVMVHKDDVLMQRIPAVPGKKGRNVLGEIIEPTGGADTPFSGDKKGVHLNPTDPNQLLSDITGQPITVPNGIIVSPVLTVKNVDLASGNIRFDGSVVVLGNVEEGMKIYALEDITIDGSVTDSRLECMGNLIIKGGVTGNSELIANGNVTVLGGIQGYNEITDSEATEEQKQEAKVISRGSVLVGFAENFSVEAGVDIVVEKYAMNNRLMAGNKIVTGAKNSAKKPSIMGGVTWAMLLVKATILGSPSGMKTYVQVGSNPYIQRRVATIKSLLVPNEKEQKDIHKILAFIDSHPERGNTELLEKLHHTLSKLVIDADSYHAELDELSKSVTIIDDAKVIAERGVYTGTEIRINNTFWKAQENRSKSVFRSEHREMTINLR
jgi:uncharacterized protein (DUF342 family)